MKTSKITTGSLITVILGVLPSLVSSIYIDPVKNSKTYPQVKVVVETLPEARGDRASSPPGEATAQREIMVPLKSYSEFKGTWHTEPDIDKTVSGYLDGTYDNLDFYKEPHFMVTISGEQDDFIRSKISKVVQMVPPENAQGVNCWLITNTGEKLGYKETPTEEIIGIIECVAFYFNKNYVQEYQEWVLPEDGVAEAAGE